MKPNLRIIKKLSKRAAKLMPGVGWDCEELEPHCERFGYLSPFTPVLWYRCSYEYQEYESICAWNVLKRIFLNERDSAIACDEGWYWPMKPTPENIMYWAYYNPCKLERVTNGHFGY